MSSLFIAIFDMMILSFRKREMSDAQQQLYEVDVFSAFSRRRMRKLSGQRFATAGHRLIVRLREAQCLVGSPACPRR